MSLYKRFLSLCQMWPVDPTKTGRDAGAYIRQKVGEYFRLGDASPIADRATCEAYYESLRRIATNYHGNKFHRARKTGAMAISQERCSAIVSNHMLELANRKQPSRISIFKDKLLRKELPEMPDKELPKS